MDPSQQSQILSASAASSSSAASNSASASSNGNGEPSETASSCELNLNAKGQVQFAVKFRYATPDALIGRTQNDIKAFVDGLRITLRELNLRLAGDL